MRAAEVVIYLSASCGLGAALAWWVERGGGKRHPFRVVTGELGVRE